MFIKKLKNKIILFSFSATVLCIAALNTGCDNFEGPLDFSKYDTNNDGRLSREEFKKTKLSMTEFSRLDTNNDKYISKKEFQFLKINF